MDLWLEIQGTAVPVQMKDSREAKCLCFFLKQMFDKLIIIIINLLKHLGTSSRAQFCICKGWESLLYHNHLLFLNTLNINYETGKKETSHFSFRGLILNRPCGNMNPPCGTTNVIEWFVIQVFRCKDASAEFQGSSFTVGSRKLRCMFLCLSHQNHIVPNRFRHVLSQNYGKNHDCLIQTGIRQRILIFTGPWFLVLLEWN